MKESLDTMKLFIAYITVRAGMIAIPYNTTMFFKDNGIVKNHAILYSIAIASFFIMVHCFNQYYTLKNVAPKVVSQS